MLERILRARIKSDGLENLNDKPTMFVINHFTRAETLIVPYILYKNTSRYVRSLADQHLFHGRLGEYLRNMGVMSIREPDRDKIIIKDLVCHSSDWLIYPEGVMVKSKKIFKHGKLILSTPNHVGAPHTGAAMLALKAEVYKRRIKKALDENNIQDANKICKELNIESPNDICFEDINIMPVTISYYPLRPGQNIIKKMVKKFFKEIPKRLEEELEIEGNLFLRDSDVNIYFGAPIIASEYLQKFFLINKIAPFWRSIEKNNLLLRMNATTMTRDFMSEIYTNIQINLDHLFCSGLKYCRANTIWASDFYRSLYATAAHLRDRQEHRLHPNVVDDIVKLQTNEPHKALNDIRCLAESLEILTEKDGYLHINHLRLNMMHMFHTVRVKNPIIVIANELEPLSDVTRMIRINVNASSKTVRRKIPRLISDYDREIFINDYKKNHIPNISKPQEIGQPFFLRSHTTNIGVVLCHGLLSAPEEVRLLAEHLHEKGISVYGVRLRGHGTSPEDLSKMHWQDWHLSFLRGYAVIKACCEKIVLGGFSTGGTLALHVAASRENRISGVFAVNAPIQMKDIHAQHAGAVNICNAVLDFCKLGRHRIDYVDSMPENPDINYNRIPLNGLAQLDALMDNCWKSLPKIKSPTYLVCGDKDPIVDPASSSRILGQLSADDKVLETMPFKRHVIVRRRDSQAVFERLSSFVFSVTNDEKK